MKLVTTFLFLTIIPYHVSASSASFTPVALTFDDLPSSGEEITGLSKKQISDEIISVLKKNRIPEVYGLVNARVAQNMQERLQILADWKKAGYLLGNHTYSHLGYTQKSFDEFTLDIEKNENLLIDFASNIPEIKVFRFPFLEEGETTEKRYALRSYFKKRAYRIAQATIDFEDWAWLEPFARCMKSGNTKKIEELKRKYLSFAMARYKSALQVSQLIWGKKEIKHILLLHFNGPTSLWLQDLIDLLKKEKVKFISAKQAIFDPFYDEDTTYTGSIGKTFIMQALETRKIPLVGIVIPQNERDWLSQQCN